MSYTKTERAAIAKVFKEALKVLTPKYRPTDYICHAIVWVTEPSQEQARAKIIISERLEGESTLSDWLFAQGVPADQLTPTRLNKHRCEWLTLLIKEFSK